MGMRTLLAPALLLVAVGCGSLPSPVEEYRPFKQIGDAIEQMDESDQFSYVEDLGRALWSEGEAEFHRRDTKGQPSIPNWGDLVRELLRRSKQDLLVQVLKVNRIGDLQYGELADVLIKLEEPRMPEILLEHSEPQIKPIDHWCDLEDPHRVSAAIRLTHYLKDPSYGEEVLDRLIDLVKRDRDSTTRGFAAQALGESDRQEAIATLIGALRDHGYVRTPNGDPSDGVSRRAEGALKKIEARRGQTTTPQGAP